MSSNNENTSDFLNDDDDDGFDIEKFASEFEDSSFDGYESDGEEILEEAPDEELETDDFEVSPSNILEGMLFVGNSENRPLTAEEMATLMRGVSEDEIDDLVAGLNSSYRVSESPFEIIYEEDGYRLVLAKEHEFCRQRFYREQKAATLSQSVVDVLSLVAYLQPVTKKEIEAKRHKPSGSLLNQLIRRKLLEIERKKVDGKSKTLYRTTDRFLDLFGLDSLDELPKSQAFESPG